MSNIKVCIECEMEFDPNSLEKIKAGGLATHCADCSEETAISYLGVCGADGKTSSINILAFQSEEDRHKYKIFWDNVTGKHKGKVACLSRTAKTDPGIKFKIISQDKATNHKGKA